MASKSYHHGDLKNALIEAGIELINEDGEKSLSLRKVAARCGVSNAAPYAHFKDKEEMIRAMQEHVTESFMKSLKAVLDPYLEREDYENGLLAMGYEYVRFFLRHPAYFSFLFSQPCMKAELSMSRSSEENFPPYQLMRDTILKWTDTFSQQLTNDELEIKIIRMWSTVHGIASIAMMKNVTWDKMWEDEIIKIIV